MVEFNVSFPSILTFYSLPAFFLFFLLTGLSILLPGTLHCRYVALLFALSILIWVQGDIFVWKYGLLDGHPFDWTKGQWRGWLDAAVWIFILVGGLIFYRRLYKAAALCCVVLLFLQFLHLGFMSFQIPKIWKSEDRLSGQTLPPKELFQLSETENVIHVVLDQFQSDIFEEIVMEDREFYLKKLQGFTFFRQTTGSFPTTYLSIPVILSGKKYKNDMPISTFMEAVFTGKTIPNVLRDNGYEVDLAYALPNYKGGLYSSYYHIPVPYGLTEKQYTESSAAFLIDLVLFRAAPHFLKTFIYNDQRWLFQRMLFEQMRLLHGTKTGEKLGMGYFAHSRFLDDLIEKLVVKRKRPVYKFIHLIASHGPFIVDENCQYAGRALPNTRKNIKAQQRCALNHFLRFLDKLRDLNVYESSLILVHADHGAGTDVKMSADDSNSKEGLSHLRKIAGAASPLMLVKLKNNDGPMRFSDAPAMLSDVPSTISSTLNLKEKFPGCSIIQIDQNDVRERRFYMYRWKNENWTRDFVDWMDEYVIVGNAFEAASWKKEDTIFPAGTYDYQIHKIDFGKTEANRFKGSGWGGDERSRDDDYTFNWALGDAAELFVPLPKNNSLLLEANLASSASNKPQRITVEVDGQVVAKWELPTPWQLLKKKAVIPADRDRPDVSIIKFTFSRHGSIQNEKRPVAVMFESILLREMKENS